MLRLKYTSEASLPAPAFSNRSEEHTSESSHLVISYAVFCLKKKQITADRSGERAPRPGDTSRLAMLEAQAGLDRPGREARAAEGRTVPDPFGFFFFLKDPAPPEIYLLPLPAAPPI